MPSFREDRKVQSTKTFSLRSTTGSKNLPITAVISFLPEHLLTFHKFLSLLSIYLACPLAQVRWHLSCLEPWIHLLFFSKWAVFKIIFCWDMPQEALGPVSLLLSKYFHDEKTGINYPHCRPKQQKTAVTPTRSFCSTSSHLTCLQLSHSFMFHSPTHSFIPYPYSLLLIDPNPFILSFSANLPLKLNNLFCSFSLSLSSFTYTQHPLIHSLLIPFQLTSPQLKNSITTYQREQSSFNLLPHYWNSTASLVTGQ